ncbi:MAG TPA: adenylate/guanylate cyclase domain-containing protein [Dehalococcoidia bacterium]|nr:adenylate/guanylate cyclase domain-containing protein [Dehalococcoidia bacterium]
MSKPEATLPSGTVTFLFTDIEGSTRLLAELGDDYADVLAAHRRALRAAFTRHGGVEVGTEGDSFFIAFESASEAVAAAREGQANLADERVRVRMGLHTGQPLITDEGYVGMDVHRAARIASVAHGGQVIFSEQTRSQTGDELTITDLGLHRLKDLGQPEHLYQLGDERFPPLRSLNATNLPAQPNALIGRERELADIAALLSDGVRLLTLSGPGGTGKTRLALQAAAELVDEFKDGVFWVPLAAVTDPLVVVSSIEQTLGAKVPLADHVDEKRILLLLDNLEQVVEAGPALVDLLERCPNLHLLVTSRVLLRVSAEREYEVPVLPDDEAVALFKERATVAEPRETVVEICRRLDGLPLAIELAAARTRVLSPEALLERLDQRLPLLTGGARDAPERQRTLRATIEWSYDLLNDDERKLFDRLAVFAGSFTTEAAEEVCGADLDTLQALVEHSLLRRWASGRLGMLETIHEFAVERFEQRDDRDVLRRRHAECLLRTLEAANLSVEAIQAERPNRYDLAAPEIDNVRAVLDWALRSRETELGLRIAIALEQFWVSSLPFEGARWFEQLLQTADNLPPSLRAPALRAYGGSVYIVGEFERGTSLYEQSLAEYRSLGDEPGTGHLLFRIAYEEFRRGEHVEARALVEESLQVQRRLGIRADTAQVLTLLADMAMVEGDREKALDLYRQSAKMARQSGFIWWLQSALLSVVELSMELGDLAGASNALYESLQLGRQTVDRQGSVYALAVSAGLAAKKGDLYHAGLCWGAVEAEESRGRIGQWETGPDREKYWLLVRATPGPELELGLAEGRNLSLDEAIERALASLPSGMIPT